MKRPFWWGLIAALLLAACTGLTPAATPTATVVPSATVVPTLAPIERLYPVPHIDGPEYGIQTFLWWHVDNKTAWRDADLVRDLGFQWLKETFPWARISGSRGGYDWFRPDLVVQLAEERGLKLLVRLDYPPEWARPADPATGPADPVLFAEFCAAVAERYAGRIGAYEIWNEPNLAREWSGLPPDPAAYVELLKACYVAIKAADPDAIVISAGMAPTEQDDAVAMNDLKYFEAMYAAGAAPYFDMLGAHAPGYGSAPEVSREEAAADPFWQSGVWVFRHVEAVRELMVALGDGDKQVAITEMGWTSDQVDPNYSWYAVDEETRADYLVRAFQYGREHWQPWIGLMSMIYIADPQWTEADEQYWWSITRPTAPGEPAELLPAYEALREMEK